jgi:hypothetical protein
MLKMFGLEKFASESLDSKNSCCNGGLLLRLLEFRVDEPMARPLGDKTLAAARSCEPTV